MELQEVRNEILDIRRRMMTVAPGSIEFSNLTVALINLYDLHMKMSVAEIYRLEAKVA